MDVDYSSINLTTRLNDLVGVSIWGALAHNCAQWLLAYLLFVRSSALLSLLFLIPALSVVTGAITGLLARWSLERLIHRWPQANG